MTTHVMSQRYAGLSIKSPPSVEKCRLVSAMMSLNHFPAYSKFSRTATKWIRAKNIGNHKIKTYLRDMAKIPFFFPAYANALDSDWKNSLPWKRTMVKTKFSLWQVRVSTSTIQVIQKTIDGSPAANHASRRTRLPVSYIACRSV